LNTRTTHHRDHGQTHNDNVVPLSFIDFRIFVRHGCENHYANDDRIAENHFANDGGAADRYDPHAT